MLHSHVGWINAEWRRIIALLAYYHNFLKCFQYPYLAYGDCLS